MQTANAIKALVESDQTATENERKAILNALRGNKTSRPKLISKKIAAEILDCSTKSIDRLTERGYLHPVHFSKRKVRLHEQEVVDLAHTGIREAAAS